MLKEETTPKPNSRNASLYFFTNIGIRVLLNTFPSQQLSIVSHARLLSSIINFSNSDFFSCLSSRNWRNSLLDGSGRTPVVEFLSELMFWRSVAMQGLGDALSSLGSEGNVLKIFSHSSVKLVFTASFRISPDFWILHFSYMNWLVCTILASCGRANSTSSSSVSLSLNNSRSLAFRW